MILEIEDKKYDIGYGTFDESISNLKRNKVIKVGIPLNISRTSHGLAFDYFKGLETVDKIKISKNRYSWVFLNCKIDKIHLAPSKYNIGCDKVLILNITFDDVIGSHSDELIKGMIRDKKLNELLKQTDK